MILSFSVPYMFSPGVFCAPALLHLLPQQPHSSPGAFQAGLRGPPVHTGLPGSVPAAQPGGPPLPQGRQETLLPCSSRSVWPNLSRILTPELPSAFPITMPKQIIGI